MINLGLRLNTQPFAKPDSDGDKWMQIIAATEFSEIKKKIEIQGRIDHLKLQESLRDILQLHGDCRSLRRMATLWRNTRWRDMITEWCSVPLGRQIFHITNWEHMVSLRIDDVR